LFIALLNYILNYIHSAHPQVLRSVLHDFHEALDRPRSKKCFKK